MKVIFLDIDGVLNSVSFLKSRRRPARAGRSTRDPRDDIDPSAVKVLIDHLLVKVPDARIVISSTWRHAFSFSHIASMLSKFGLDPALVIGATPTMGPPTRGMEIDSWLKANPSDSFVIIDDIADGMDPHISNLVLTDPGVGLTPDDATRAIVILNWV